MCVHNSEMSIQSRNPKQKKNGGLAIMAYIYYYYAYIIWYIDRPTQNNKDVCVNYVGQIF